MIEVTDQKLLRSMNALVGHKASIGGVTASLLRFLDDQCLSLAFYDMTTLSARSSRNSFGTKKTGWQFNTPSGQRTR